jgi:LytS/YehU family sensor histidine kinase
VRRLLGREEHSTPYLRVLIVSLLLFVPVSVGEQVLVERYLFGKSHASYTILRYAAFQTTWHLIVANGYIAYRYLTELGRARSRLLTAERDRAETELRRLQQAVSPHFLFNALNVLHALIADDPGRAGEFTTRLARLYRYILRHRDVEVVSLRDELAFVRDYAYLLQTRFGGAWRFEIDDAPPGADLFVVPAAVQGLVENAVKHNVARVEHPVTLSIRIEGDGLVVRNPRHPRADAAASSGAGLDLLRARYARLDDRGVRVHASDDAFEVTLPLIRAV